MEYIDMDDMEAAWEATQIEWLRLWLDELIEVDVPNAPDDTFPEEQPGAEEQPGDDDLLEQRHELVMEEEEISVGLGRIEYTLEYDNEKGQLAVTVIRAENLPAMDSSGTSDPYVKLYLLPEKKTEVETKVHRKTLNPVFKETFTFEVPFNELSSKTLVFSIYDYDPISKHYQIGQLLLPLDMIDLGEVVVEDIEPPPDDTEADQQQ